ncbi:hypothetical protein JHK87_031346 [Glycine soja]|nr:hypothetical protein JHK87_031346 [Glycine soja]
MLTHIVTNPTHDTTTFSCFPLPYTMPKSRDCRVTVVNLVTSLARRCISFIYNDALTLCTPLRTATLGRGRARISPGSKNIPQSTARCGRGRILLCSMLLAWYPMIRFFFFFLRHR